MRYLAVILGFAAIAMAGCSSGLTSHKEPRSIVGTWQWVQVDTQVVNEPFFVRYYADGRAATWPAPAGWSTTTNGVSYGGYHVSAGFLVIETGAGTNDPMTRIKIRGSEMVLINDESNRLIYHQVVPDLEPGKLLPGQVSHGAPGF